MGRSRQQNPSAPQPLEILAGSDALHFLCSNSDIDKKHSCMRKSNAFCTLYSEMKTSQSSMASFASSASLQYPPPITSVRRSPRNQRKAYKPSRVLPLEEEPTQPTLDKSVLTDDLPSLKSMFTCPTTQDDDTLNKKKPGVSSKGSKHNHQDSCMVSTITRKRNRRHNLHSSDTVVCKNLACKAVLRAGSSFCRRCSCCICKEFDDNKDPSLWITCDAEEQEGCGLTCHVECALQGGVAGVIKKGSLDGSFEGGVAGVIKKGSLDGSFVCRSCGRVSSLLGLWKKQLLVAKDARRVDVLCHRLLLSHRLLKNTVKYKNAYAPIDNAVKKLEAEVRLLNKDYAKLERCIVNRLSCNAEVQKLIALALERVEGLCDAQSVIVGAKDAETHKKASCTMQFEDVCASSIVVVAVDNHPCDDRLGYKLWHRKATDFSYPAAPTYTIQSTAKKVMVLNLQPHTSYAFKMAPFSKGGDEEECEAECCTVAMESMVVENHVNDDISGCVHHAETDVTEDRQYHISAMLQFIHDGRAEKQGGALENLSNSKTPSTLEVYQVKDNRSMEEPGHAQKGLAVANKRRMSSRKDVCETTELPSVTPHGELEKEKEEVFVIGDAFENSSPTMVKTGNVDITDYSNAASESWHVQLHCSDARTGMLTRGEVASNGRDGTAHVNGQVDLHNLKFPMRVIRWLERLGHLEKEFRMKFLTWYSLRAMEHEKRVVSVFIDTLQDSPASLAAQLVDAFQDVINSKRQRVTEMGHSQ